MVLWLTVGELIWGYAWLKPCTFERGHFGACGTRCAQTVLGAQGFLVEIYRFRQRYPKTS